MAQYDLVIQNGTVVNPAGTFRADIGVRAGKVVCIADRLTDAVRCYDAQGKLVMPGGIDIHTHIDTPLNGSHTLDDWYQGTVSAACGGVTCVVDYPMQEKGHSLRDIICKWSEKAGGSAVIDYSFSPVITERTEQAYAEIPKLIEEGFPTWKVYMAYWHRVRDEEIIRLLDVISSNGGILGIHCENDFAIDYLTKKLLDAGKTEPKYHPVSRPPVCEEDATQRVINLAEMVDANVLIVHMSCERALRRAQEAHAKNNNVYVETCPHFLLLDESAYDAPLEQAAKYVITPPLRRESDRAALWQGIRNGDIKLVSSDHCAFPFKEKLSLGRESFATIPHGAPGVEGRLPVVFSEGVSKGRISAEKFVEIVSTNPARIAGMYPKKGIIAVGSDADITVMDPHKEVTLSVKQMHSNCDFSPYDGVKVKGYPAATFSRGTLVSENGEPVEARGHGELVFRNRFERF
ncbi:MAG: dihydropyrimidinase [Oscillospiraceae bacterium]|nr:dihydropyrimidinase [Oscillospiraceae bacterium]